MSDEPASQIADDNYHALSTLAIAALVLGLLSALAFAHPLFWFMPLIAAAISIAAIVRIHRSAGELVGRRLAVSGLALAIFFGLAAPAKSFSRQAWLTHRARVVAEQFFDLLRDKNGLAAHQLTLRAEMRMASDVDLQEMYDQNKDAKKQYDEFIAREPMALLMSAGSGAQISEQSAEAMPPLDGADFVRLDYALQAPRDGSTVSQQVELGIERTLSRNLGLEQWRVYSVGAQ